MIFRNNEKGVDHIKYKHPEYEILLKKDPNAKKDKYFHYEAGPYRYLMKTDPRSNEQTSMQALFK